VVHAPAALARPLDEWVFERAGARQVIRVSPVFRTDDREALIAAVLDGAGIMRIGLFDPALVAAGRLRQILAEWSCPGGQSFYAMYRKAARLPLRIGAFLAFVEQAFAAFDPDGITMVKTRPTRSSRGSADP
jgi:DNA-binding transcriptional LysR family regulator